VVLMVPVVIGLVAAGAVAYAYFRLTQYLRVHVPADRQVPADFGLETERVELGPSERRIVGWLVEADQPRGGVVLVHGLGLPRGGKAQMLAHAAYLRHHGLSTLAIDLFSFGESDGARIALGAEEWMDVRAGFEFLSGRSELEGKPVGVFGISMGGVASIIAAGKEPGIDFVIASVPYPTIGDLLRQQMVLERKPLWLFGGPVGVAAKILISNEENAIDYIGVIRVPVMLLGGRYDETVPLESVRRLKTLGGENVSLAEFDAGHDIHAENPELFEKTILEFLGKISDDPGS
jgi:uncharacterized protein